MAWDHSITAQCKICVTIESRTFLWSQASTHTDSPSAWSYRSGRFLGEYRRGSESRSFLGWCNFNKTGEQLPISLCFVESQVPLFEAKSVQVRELQKLRSCPRPWQEVEWFRGFFFLKKKKTDMMHMVFVVENDTCGTQEWTISKFASHVALWRGRGSSSGHFVMMSKCNHGTRKRKWLRTHDESEWSLNISRDVFELYAQSSLAVT